MSEKLLLNDIQLTASQSRRCILFRNNIGMGWIGRVIRQTPSEITLADYRPLHAGLCKGSADLIGWTTVEITPEMVGRKIAVFTALEAKTAGVRLTKEQRNFIARLNESGGIGNEIRDCNAVSGIILEFEKRK